MLDPRDRSQLFECVRPPLGYVLDQGITTTYSLDLLTLLALPLAFSVFDREDDEKAGHADSLALLESLRRYSDRLTIYCQRGQIHVPPAGRPLLAYLENAVCEANAPRGGVFHPKLTVLRFVPSEPVSSKAGGEEGEAPVRYRLLCATRNLTFDRAWDTVLRLEGVLTNRQRSIANNRPLADFVAALPAFAVRPVGEDRLNANRRIAAEILTTRFELPPNVESVRFSPMGLDGHSSDPLQGMFDRLLIISPFLAENRIRELAERSARISVVSRCDALDALSEAALERLQEAYFLNAAIDSTGAGESDDHAAPDDAQTLAFNTELRGLHAKLYVAESGRMARLWTGSANATSAASRRNVEFLVELSGARSKLGIDAILGGPEGRGGAPSLATTLRDLLLPYRRDAAPPPPSPLAQRLEELVEDARRAICGGSLGTRVEELNSDRFELTVECAHPASIRPPEGVQIRCWPISLPSNAAVAPDFGRSAVAVFPAVSFRAITGFIAFELTARIEAQALRTSFVLNLPLDGAPDDRSSRLILELLRSRGDVIRYLSLLLADDPLDTQPLDPELGTTGNRLKPEPASGGLPLLEPLLHTLDCHPTRLDAVAAVVEDLRRTPEGRNLLPDRFDEIWDPIWDLRQRLRP